MQSLAKQQKRISRVLNVHLTDCAQASRRTTRALKQVQRHLQGQDNDLQEIRVIKKMVGAAWLSMGSIVALLELIRLFMGH